MSDLKYKSVEDLRQEIASIERYQARLYKEAAIAETEAKRLSFEAAEKRVKAHNAGQRMAWARIYLAQKV